MCKIFVDQVKILQISQYIFFLYDHINLDENTTPVTKMRERPSPHRNQKNNSPAIKPLISYYPDKGFSYIKIFTQILYSNNIYCNILELFYVLLY